MTGASIVLAGGRSSRFGRDKLPSRSTAGRCWTTPSTRVRPIAAEIIVVAAPDADARRPRRRPRRPRSGRLRGPAGRRARGGSRPRTESIVVVVGGDMPTSSAPSSSRWSWRSTRVRRRRPRARRSPAAAPDGVRASRRCAAAGRAPRSGERRLRALIEALATPVIAETAWRALDPDGRDPARHRHRGRPGLTPSDRRTHEDPRRRKRRSSCLGGRSEAEEEVSPRTGSSVSFGTTGSECRSDDPEAGGGGGDPRAEAPLGEPARPIRLRWLLGPQAVEVLVHVDDRDGVHWVSPFRCPGSVPVRNRSIAPPAARHHRRPTPNRHRHASMPAARVSPRARAPRGRRPRRRTSRRPAPRRWRRRRGRTGRGRGPPGRPSCRPRSSRPRPRGG